jgi:hypothetical protein
MIRKKRALVGSQVVPPCGSLDGGTNDASCTGITHWVERGSYSPHVRKEPGNASQGVQTFQLIEDYMELASESCL